MKNTLILFTFLFLSFSGIESTAQSFTLPSDGNWYRIATMSGRHAYIQYVYSHNTGHNPSILKGEIEFINARSYMIHQSQSMGYGTWNQPQFALINKSNVTELWIKASANVNSGPFEVIYSQYANLSSMGTISDSDLSDNGGILKIYERIPANGHQFTSNLSVIDGNVSIGTPVPDARLTVNGTVHAEEVKVDLSVPGPDYVFEEDYPLASLDEIKAYISENKHLPEVPSAKEMESNGIKLGEMNMLLLKKIEELTLLLIQEREENKKEIHHLKQEINQLKSK